MHTNIYAITHTHTHVPTKPQRVRACRCACIRTYTPTDEPDGPALIIDSVGRSSEVLNRHIRAADLNVVYIIAAFYADLDAGGRYGKVAQ